MCGNYCNAKNQQTQKYTLHERIPFVSILLKKKNYSKPFLGFSLSLQRSVFRKSDIFI